MTVEKENTYQAAIWLFKGGTVVTYYVTATDDAPQTTVSDTYSFTAPNHYTFPDTARGGETSDYKHLHRRHNRR